ncbi:MAG TPA: Spy/CpxP family protein refolding chaperone [Stellaceae bacterium]|nr:Spy/CpxP family protein refolding chaperone [Stellaceae bacterium]
MSDSNRRNGLAVSLAGAAAIVALIGTAPISAQAQTRATPAPSQAAPARSAATSAKQGNGVEQQISQLHSELKITPEQEAKWNPVAQAMRDNAAGLQKLMEQKQPTKTTMTAVEDLETNQQFVQAHLDGLKNFTAAFKSLYDSMSDQQKKNADQVFAKMNRAPQGARNG